MLLAKNRTIKSCDSKTKKTQMQVVDNNSFVNFDDNLNIDYRLLYQLLSTITAENQRIKRKIPTPATAQIADL